MKVHVVERAFQLAASGEHTTLTSLQEALAAEGYTGTSIRAHLEGPTIRRDLAARMKASVT